MAAASKNCRFAYVITPKRRNRQFFESPGYPLLPKKNALGLESVHLYSFKAFFIGIRYYPCCFSIYDYLMYDVRFFAPWCRVPMCVAYRYLIASMGVAHRYLITPLRGWKNAV